jgi:regulatory protein
MADRAYVDGLKLLARRELSEAQVRQRLARRDYPADEIDAAIERLKAERALDDARVARAIARTQVSFRRRGRLRVRREIEAAGIAPAVAARAVDEAFQDVDPDALLNEAIARRLRDGATIPDEATFRRLYRFLVTQGFDSDRVLQALRARRAGR